MLCDASLCLKQKGSEIVNWVVGRDVLEACPLQCFRGLPDRAQLQLLLRLTIGYGLSAPPSALRRPTDISTWH